MRGKQRGGRVHGKQEGRGGEGKGEVRERLLVR